MPAANSLLLDTTAVIAYFRNEPSAVRILRQQEMLYLPLVALGELYLGIERAQNRAKAGKQLDELLSFVNILYPDQETAALYGSVKAKLLLKGTPIPDNDIWIAAAARQANLSLATRDAHFARVTGIDIVDI
jgi:tRNA(fMet)-specific endonuclease VapC